MSIEFGRVGVDILVNEIKGVSFLHTLNEFPIVLPGTGVAPPEKEFTRITN